MLRLLDLPVVGQGIHRSGWPYARRALEPLHVPGSQLLLDDFAERTFLYDERWNGGLCHDSPWVGIFHHPPDVPGWCFEHFCLDRSAMRWSARWRASARRLELAICLADHVTDWARSELGVPAVTIRHPSEIPARTFTLDAYAKNGRKRLVQVGTFLRNTRAIDQVAAPGFLEKTRLRQDAEGARAHDAACDRQNAARARPRANVGRVEELGPQHDDAYDALLSENVVLVELVCAAANNTIVECIARSTPVAVNRLPGVEFYLGREYPLFFDGLDEVPGLLSDDRIAAAHGYLSRMDKSWLAASSFREAVRAACAPVAERLPPRRWWSRAR